MYHTSTLSDIRTDIEVASVMMSTINVDSLWSYTSAVQHIVADIVQTEIADTVHRANGNWNEGQLFMCLPHSPIVSRHLLFDLTLPHWLVVIRVLTQREDIQGTHVISVRNE